MLDSSLLPFAKRALQPLVWLANYLRLKPNHITLGGFLIGLCSALAIAYGVFILALILLLVNRVMDGLDGELARQLKQNSAAGGFLDICLDFIFYSAIPCAFIAYDPTQNGLAGGLLMLSFMASGSSFLAFAAACKNTVSIEYPQKSMYYLSGLIEGSETCVFFIVICLWPAYFSWIALVFAGLCFISAALRIRYGTQSLQK